MPFKSLAQLRLLYAKHPDIAKKWSREYGPPGPGLPEHVKKPKKKKEMKP